MANDFTPYMKEPQDHIYTGVELCSEPARDERPANAVIQIVRVIVNVFREQRNAA